MKKAGLRTIILLILVPVCFSVLAVIFISNYLKARYELIYAENALKVSGISNGFNTYLDEVEILVDSAAEGIEYLVKQDADHDQIHDYLAEVYEDYARAVADDTDGLYGYINGEYNDGYGWTPYDGYAPQEREWCKAAIAASNQTIMVEPYRDLRTDNTVVTFARALRNGRDVIALDLDLKEIQDHAESLTFEDEDHDILIVDDYGWVIASSMKGEIGRNYKEDGDVERQQVYETWMDNNGEPIIIKIKDERYLISQEPIKFGWTAVSVSNINTVYNMLRNIVFVSAVVILTCAILLALLILVIAKRRIKADDDTESLQAVSSIYTTIHKVDLLDNSFRQIRCNDYMVSEAIGNRRADNARVITEVMRKVTEQRSLDEVLEFVDLSTLDERMRFKDTISVEFLNYEHIWFRGRFIAVNRFNDGKLKTILWAVEQIDDEKRYMDKLQYLAETDQLTGINNRGSGEHKIRELIRNGKGGTFVLFDADKFKSINDNYGHDAGDKVLIAIAECMHHSFRDRDIIMRLGGDEFAVYIPFVYTRQDSEPIINRFIDAIKKINLSEIEGKPISISLGVAFYHPCEEFTFEELYRRADECTYESKKVAGCYATYYSG